MPADADGEAGESARPGHVDRDAVGAAPAGLQAQFGEELGRLHAMVETLSRQRTDRPPASRPARRAGADLLAIDRGRRARGAWPADWSGTSPTKLEPDQFDHPESIRAALCEAVEQCIPVAPPIRPVAGTRRVVALVGPTGRRQDDDGRQARGQLQAGPRRARRAGHGRYLPDRGGRAAQDLCRDHRPAAGRGQRPGEMPRALDELGAVDLVFIDTAGRSPRDEVKIRELAEFLLQARPDEVHLVLSAVAGERSLRSAVERFADGPGRPPDPDQARRGRQPGRRAGRARAFQPPRELPDDRPGRPRRHRAGRPQAAGAADPQTGGPVLGVCQSRGARSSRIQADHGFGSSVRREETHVRPG